MDFFFYGYAKDHVYFDNHPPLDHLRINIRHVMVEIQPEMCEKAIEIYLHKIPWLSLHNGKFQLTWFKNDNKILILIGFNFSLLYFVICQSQTPNVNEAFANTCMYESNRGSGGIFNNLMLKGIKGHQQFMFLYCNNPSR